MLVMCLHFSVWPISIHNWVYIFHRVLSDPYSDVLYSEGCQTKKLSVVSCEMFALLSHFQVLYSENIVKIYWIRWSSTPCNYQRATEMHLN